MSAKTLGDELHEENTQSAWKREIDRRGQTTSALDDIVNLSLGITAKKAKADLAQLRADLQAAQERIAELEEPLEAFSLAHDLATASIYSPLLVRYAMQLEQRSAEQARQLDAARNVMSALHDYEKEFDICPVCNHAPNDCECGYSGIRAWLAANPAPEAEHKP